jgi:pyruvate dehydrogenase E2 component (dihydrolipoamide acetyltransferase)
MTATDTIDVVVPDIGDFGEIPVIEILVGPGDTVALDDPLVTLESDKATMDVPAPVAGVVRELRVKVGDKVSEGTLLLTLSSLGNGDVPSADAAPTAAVPPTAKGPAPHAATSPQAPSPPPAAATSPEPAAATSPEAPSPPPAAATSPEPAAATSPEAPSPPPAAATSPEPARPAEIASAPSGPVYASPSVRRIARERGVDLTQVAGSGRKGRIMKADVEGFDGRPPPASAGAAPAGAQAIPGLDLAPWPKVDFEKFGPVERVERTRIQKISAPNLARNWVMIPHVTHNDEADITELEAFRKRVNEEHAKEGVKLTMVGFLVAASVATLKEFPTFNSSLDGDVLVIRRYYNIGFAADTPQGLVVPVIKDADKKGILQIARDLTDLSGKAREGKLAPGDMSGGTFTISSLGGIGGTSFTPIINAPEVAILGATRSTMKPVWSGSSFEPRLMVPLSLSYDHRVVDGAAAARFMVHLVGVLSDLRRALL